MDVDELFGVFEGDGGAEADKGNDDDNNKE